jgi:hypothetical protein
MGGWRNEREKPGDEVCSLFLLLSNMSDDIVPFHEQQT